MNTQRVLVVDDIDVNRKLASVCATRLGWTVVEAHDGQSALALLETERFAAMLLDINMPGIGGEEVLAQLMASPAIKPARVIAYTAHAMPEHRQRFLALGFDDLLIKPITLARLEEALGRAGT